MPGPMTNLLDYAPSAARSRWPQRLPAALIPCGFGAVAVVAAGTLSTAAMHRFRAREGQPTLFGLPDSDYYQLWIFVIPALLLTGLILTGWARAVWRCGRGDRLPVAGLADAPLVGLWCAGMYWLLTIFDRVFP